MVVAVDSSGQFAHPFTEGFVSEFVFLTCWCRDWNKHDVPTRISILRHHTWCRHLCHCLKGSSILEVINHLPVGNFLFTHVSDAFGKIFAELCLRLFQLLSECIVHLCHTFWLFSLLSASFQLARRDIFCFSERRQSIRQIKEWKIRSTWLRKILCYGFDVWRCLRQLCKTISREAQMNKWNMILSLSFYPWMSVWKKYSSKYKMYTFWGWQRWQRPIHWVSIASIPEPALTNVDLRWQNQVPVKISKPSVDKPWVTFLILYFLKKVEMYCITGAFTQPSLAVSRLSPLSTLSTLKYMPFSIWENT